MMRDNLRARRRLAREKRLGTRKTRGAARLHTRTVAEMKKNRAAARRNAATPRPARKAAALGKHRLRFIATGPRNTESGKRKETHWQAPETASS